MTPRPRRGTRMAVAAGLAAAAVAALVACTSRAEEGGTIRETSPAATPGAPPPDPAGWPGWTAVHADSRNTDFAAVTGPDDVELAWELHLEGDVRIGDLDWTINLGPTSDAAGRLYVTANVPGCRLQALDLATGERRWCAPQVGPGGVLSSPLIDADGNLYLADGEAMRSFRPDGTERWAQPIVGVPLSAQLSPAGDVLLITHIGVVHLLDRATGAPELKPVALAPGLSWQPGEPLWACARGADGCPSANTPAVDPETGRIYFTWWEPGAPQAGVRAVQLLEDGRARLEDLWTTADLPGGSGASPVLSADGTRLYVTDNVSSAHALDAATGEVIWSHDIGIAAGGSLSVSPDGVILPPGGALQAFRDDGERATPLWREDALQNRGIATQAAGDRAYATVVRAPGALDLVVVDTRTGAVLDREPISGTTRFSVGITIAADGTILVPTITGTLAAFRPARG